ncbi:chaperone protein dnaJ 8, chloroplastic-like [Typha angustifolia]|uniref:chaperone protein dnaJ 8, chloroplastic-like n=1 Tax=Typha angustifolia TaxID=59011 RepID=UPI003C2C4950
MAILMGMMGSMGSASSMGGGAAGSGGVTRRWRRVRCRCGGGGGGGSLTDQYKTLKIQPGVTEKEVKKAFRQLALQYHPDVCKGSDCRVQFHRINEAYDIVMDSLRQDEDEQDQWQSQEWRSDFAGDEQMRGMYDSSWDLWEEWMGWEGAGIRDYSSHINPYI